MMHDASQGKAKNTSAVRTVEIEGKLTSSQTVEKSQVIPSEANFGPHGCGSDDDEASEVDSFILDENDMDLEGSEGVLEPSKFLLPAETEEGQTLQTVDPETHARLEALLEAAGISKLSSKDGKALTDPEVLRTLTSSVSSALDEATQAINCMRSEQQGQIQGSEGAQALSERDIGTVRKLYESGSVPDTTEEGESLLSLACSAGYYELAQVLLAMNANVEDRGVKGDCTPLMEAASGGYVEIVRLLILHGADVNAQSSAGNTPLHSAACGGHTDVVKELVCSGASVEVHNENGHTPLMEAASAGHVEVARLLLEAGAGINTHSNEFKESALTLACYKGHLEMVKFLLEAGADQEHKTDEMHTALMEASMDGHVEVARLLLDSGAQVNMPADSFESPLTLAACGGHVELANLLIERGASIEEVNDEGYTPLMEAAREGHEEMVALLLANGADINAQTEETQETALTLACCGGFLEVAEFLIKAGADIELGCSTPLMEAAQEGHLDLVRYLLTSGANVHAQTGTCDTALTYACENGHTDVAEVLLEHGAELEHESEGGRTPLMKAARAGHMCTVQFLISKGADANRTTSTNDHTVLSLACAGGHMSVVELLLAHGADSSHKLKDGSTMIIEAAKGGHTNVVKLLLEWPNRLLLSSSVDLTQPDMPHVSQGPVDEPRVPVQGLAHIVPPSEPDPKLHSCLGMNANSQGKTADRQAAGKMLSKRPNGTPGAEAKGPGTKTSSTVIADSLQQLNPEGALLADLTDEKATEKVEAIINNIMAKELLGPSAGSKEEQLQRKQQILEELQKMERELQEKAQAQQQLEQQQQLLKARSATASSPSIRQPEEAAKKMLELNVGAAGSSGPQRGLAESLCLTGTPAVDLPLNDLVVQLPKLLSGGDVATAHPHIPSTVYPASESSIQQSPAPPSLPALSDTSGGLTSVHQLQQNPAHVQQSVVPNNGGQAGNGNSGGAKTSTKRNNSGKTMRSNKSQQQQPQQPLPPTATPQPQLLPTSQPLTQPLPAQTPSLALGLQGEHNGGSHSTEGAQMSQEALQQQQQQQLAALSQQQQHHLQQLTFPQLTPQQQDQLLQHMLSQQVLQPPLGQAPFQQPLHQLLPQGTLCQASVDVDSQTESNHDTALTLACAGGHSELVSLLLAKGADIEHRDKKGFTPLILAATAGHVDVVEILLDHGADIEAQSERTKDTPLSLACSGGRYEERDDYFQVVELLLARGANKEHRNVSDYTPLSLAASGGYVNIIKLLLSHGAEINSRTGSKLGISPLMLAAMNGHTAAVKLLLDMGSDINAQIETNRNTALTLACFQGRHEVVSLLVDRKANIEHRAKTGLTPLMEAASGGYVEVGRVLLDKGADVNAPPVPSSRDTALTIAADKGHYRFVELLLHRGAAVDVKNKKGNSPLWLACNGGHLDVVQLLVSAGADIDSQDNRKVSCLMASFRKGHVKVVKWMVRHVTQFPSDAELLRFIATITDKELQKKCQQCMDTIVTAKDRQAAEANKNATSLLQEIDKEREVEEHRRQQAAKRRERRKERKKRERLEKEKDSKDKNSSPEPESADSVQHDQGEEDEEEDNVKVEPPSATVTSTIGTTLGKMTEARNSRSNGSKSSTTTSSASVTPVSAIPPLPSIPSVSSASYSASSSSNSSSTSSAAEARKNRRNRKEKWESSHTKQIPVSAASAVSSAVSVSTSAGQLISTMTNAGGKMSLHSGSGSGSSSSSSNHPGMGNSSNSANIYSSANSKRKKVDIIKVPASSGKTRVGDLDDFGSLGGGKISSKEVDRLGKHFDKVKINTSESLGLLERDSNLAPKLSPLGTSPRKGQRKDDGWKEVIRNSCNRSKKVTVPSSAISRVIGRGGCNINAIREASGAHVEVEKSTKGSTDRVITIKGSSEATRQAHAMINSLVQEPDQELSEIIARTKGKPAEKSQQTPATIGDFAIGLFSVPTSSAQLGSNAQKSSFAAGKSGSSHSAQSNSNVNGVRSSGVSSSSGPQISAWQNPVAGPGTPSSPRRSPQKQLSVTSSHTTSPAQPSQDKPIARQLLGSDQRMAGLASPATAGNAESPASVTTASVKTSPPSSITRSAPDNRQPVSVNAGNSSGGQSGVKQASRPPPGTAHLAMRQTPPANRPEPQPLPIISGHVSGAPSSTTQAAPLSSPGNYSPFDNTIFSNVAVQFLSKKEDEKLNFASVAAHGVVPNQSSPSSGQPHGGALTPAPSQDSDPNLPAKAPGYKAGMRTASPQFRADHPGLGGPSISFPLSFVGSEQPDMRPMGFRGPVPPGSGMPPLPSFPIPNTDGVSMPTNGLQQMGAMEVNSPQSHHPHHHPHHPHHLHHPHMGHNQHMPQPNLGPSLSASQKEEYSTPDQPMTLPEIKSTLNPNAPDFHATGTSMGGPPGPGLVNGFPPNSDMHNSGDLGNSGMGFPQSLLAFQQQLMHTTLNNISNISPAALQAMQQQLLNSMQMMNPQTLSSALAGNNPEFGDQLAQLSYSIMQHLANQRAPQARSASPGLSPGPRPASSNGLGSVGAPHMGGHDVSSGGPGQMPGFSTPQGLHRNMSPMPGGPHRPSSAPTVADPGSTGPLGPSSMGSPVQPRTPPLSDEKILTPEDRRVPRPIGGERAQRKLPLNTSSTVMGGVGDFSNKLWSFSSDINMEWMSGNSPQMSAASLPSSVMTSSVVTGSNMAYSVSMQHDAPPHNTGGGMEDVGGFPDSLGGMDHNMDPAMQSWKNWSQTDM